MSFSNLRKAIGPGLLYAGAAIGVSHLVQSTRAGADYGFSLAWVIVLACVTKYAFMEFGPRYFAATGETLLHGYRKLGWWAMGLYLVSMIGTMFTIQAVVTMVTAALLSGLMSAGGPCEQLLGFSVSLGLFWWCVIVAAVTVVLLIVGRFKLLDLSVKVIIAVLSVSTIAAVIAAAVGHTPPQTHQAEAAAGSLIWFGAVLALMGWMPTPIDVSVWKSVWSSSRAEQTQHRPTLTEAKIDFNIGFIGSGILGLFFLALGALVLHDSGNTISPAAAKFGVQFISLYGASLGPWSIPIITIAAVACMLSTTLTVTDGYPRQVGVLTEIYVGKLGQAGNFAIYAGTMILVNAAALGLLYYMLAGNQNHFLLLVDIATVLSFLFAPAFALLNYVLLTSRHTPKQAQPGIAMRSLSWLSLAALVAFAGLYLYQRAPGWWAWATAAATQPS